MRMRKFREILDLLPESEDLTKVKRKFDEQALKTKSFLLKAKKISREDHVKMRKSAGFKYKFEVSESKPYDHYEFLKTLSKRIKKIEDKIN